MLCGQPANQGGGTGMEPVMIQNMDFETFTANGAPAMLQDGQYVHASNNGNSQLPEPIGITGWTAHEYANADGCNFGGNLVATGCEPCQRGDGTSCGQGLFR